MTHTATVVLVDGVRVAVPDSLNLITPYVLLEQHDWFEDEIKFLRRLLQAGQKVIDIGANHGVYALSMAHAVGPTGYVWAFEPARETATLLAEGIAANGFEHVTLEQSALSSDCGTAQLSLNANSELNALVHGNSSTTASETVSVLTLDECLERYNWRDIDFVKIDAEGEKLNILKGGGRFFSELSPLVQYEIRAGADLHLELVQQFAALGYRSYRLVPGLDALVPFDSESPPDGYLLNLFCCKQNRVEQYSGMGFLVDRQSTHPDARANPVFGIHKRAMEQAEYDWHHTIACMPYGTRLADLWERTMTTGTHADVGEALSLYAMSGDSSLSSGERFSALDACLNLITRLCEQQAPPTRLATLARVACDYGARSVAVNALRQLADAILKENGINLREPFLAPGRRFDAAPPGDAIGNWVLAAVLEALERLGSFSSFYTGPSAQRRLEVIRDLGFGSAEMGRRLDLLQRRFGGDRTL